MRGVAGTKAPHGSIVRYTYHGCRCPVCRKAVRLYYRKRGTGLSLAEYRKSVEPETDFLVNITNDGWFGEGSAQLQQAAGATFRTVENGVPLIRCANTGMTCWIDAHGRWVRRLALRKGILKARVAGARQLCHEIHARWTAIA